MAQRPRSDDAETADLPVPAMVAAASRMPRLDSVDLVRGLIMVLMALDHVRDFFSHLHFPPEDMTQTWPALFLTRWLTHFSAPGFFFLAGTGAYLSLARGRTPARVSRFLWTRGLWLVFLELTVIGYAWSFSSFGFGGVIWALGWCMVLNAAIVRLPLPWVAAFGAIMVAGHHLLDGIQAPAFGKLGWLWMILHQPGFIPLPRPSFVHLPPGAFFGFFVLYVLVPWVGVMSLGYAFGTVLRRPQEERQRWTLRIGLAATALFVVLRAFNAYGNPGRDGFIGSGAWSMQGTLGMTLVSFFNTTKYPPSLQFLLMTLGPSLMALAWFDKLAVKEKLGAIGRFFVVFGRVPLFFYILHLYLIHSMAVVVALAWGQPYDWLLHGGVFLGFPPGYGHNLPFIYLMWALAVGILYFPCKWFMDLKARRRDWWLGYL